MVGIKGRPDNLRIKEVRSSYNLLHSYSEVGRRFKISRQRVHQIVTGYSGVSSIRTPRLKKVWKKKCELCGNPPTILHRKDFDWNNNEPSNFQSLCYQCDRTIHVLERRKKYPNRCRNCKRLFGKEIRHYLLKKGLCHLCYQISKGKATGRSFFYRKTCLDCGITLISGKRQNGRCFRCNENHEYKINPERRKYHQMYYKKKYADPLYREYKLEQNRQYQIRLWLGEA